MRLRLLIASEPRIEGEALLVDLRSVDPSHDERLQVALRALQG